MSGKFLNIIPKAKLPFNFFKVLNTDSKGFEFSKNWVTKTVITSVSVCDLNLKLKKIKR